MVHFCLIYFFCIWITAFEPEAFQKMVARGCNAKDDGPKRSSLWINSTWIHQSVRSEGLREAVNQLSSRYQWAWSPTKPVCQLQWWSSVSFANLSWIAFRQLFYQNWHNYPSAMSKGPRRSPVNLVFFKVLWYLFLFYPITLIFFYHIKIAIVTWWRKCGPL